MIVDLGDIFGPAQGPITRDDIEAMIATKPRRTKLSAEWLQPLHEPPAPDRDWSLVLPFCPTLKNAFETMCGANHIGMRTGKGGRCYTYLRAAKEDPTELNRVGRWLSTVGAYVAIRDCLALSFALDYEREGGNPANPQTRVARLRSEAKPYDREPTEAMGEAADRLVDECLEFLDRMTCYGSATCVVAMPPSKPDRPFDLTRRLAAGIAARWERPDRSAGVRTVRPRASVREAKHGDKLGTIEGSVTVDAEAVRGEVVLLVDDLYQSGVSMNYVAMLLLAAGAKKVFGLCCEKTCTNDDNVSRGFRG